MAFGGRNKGSTAAKAASSLGYQTVVSLIRTRLDLRVSVQHLAAAGVYQERALRYLDLAMVVAVRELLDPLETVELPDSYAPVSDDTPRHPRFDACRVATELARVYQAEPDAATILGRMAPEFVAVNNALGGGTPAVRLGPARVGDGSQVAFARTTFGDDAVINLAQGWPALA